MAEAGERDEVCRVQQVCSCVLPKLRSRTSLQNRSMVPDTYDILLFPFEDNSKLRPGQKALLPEEELLAVLTGEFCMGIKGRRVFAALGILAKARLRHQLGCRAQASQPFPERSTSQVLKGDRIRFATSKCGLPIAVLEAASPCSKASFKSCQAQGFLDLTLGSQLLHVRCARLGIQLSRTSRRFWRVIRTPRHTLKPLAQYFELESLDSGTYCIGTYRWAFVMRCHATGLFPGNLAGITRWNLQLSCLP